MISAFGTLVLGASDPFLDGNGEVVSRLGASTIGLVGYDGDLVFNLPAAVGGGGSNVGGALVHHFRNMGVY